MADDLRERWTKKVFKEFIKAYKQFCKQQNPHDTTTNFYYYIMDELSCPIARKQVKTLVDKSSLDVKFMFNTFYNFYAPQKRWFLEDPHNCDLLPRSPCNSPAYFVHTLRQSGFYDTSMLVNCFPETIFAERSEISIVDNICQVTLQLPEKEYFVQLVYNAQHNDYGILHNENFFSPEQRDALRPYIPLHTFNWLTGQLELSPDGKIRYNGFDVTILLEEDISHAKIKQMHVRNHETIRNSKLHIIILFESWFLASGEIRIGQDGRMTIHCQEIPGSYPTAYFATTNTLGLLVRSTPVLQKKPNDCLTPDYFRFEMAVLMLDNFRKRNPGMFYHNHNNVSRQPYRDYTDRDKYLPLFCEDMFYLVNIHNDNSFSDPNLFLSEREKFICRYYQFRANEEDGKLSYSCLSKDGCCENLKKFIGLALTLYGKVQTHRAEIKEKEKVIINMIMYMCEVILAFLADRDTKPLLIEYRTLCVENPEKMFTHGVYSPMNTYELMITQQIMDAEIDVADISNLIEYINRREWHSVALLLFHRPDILCFSSAFVEDFQGYPFPLQLIRKFSELYPEIRKGGMSDRRKNEIINALQNWMLKEKETPNKQLQGSRYKKKKRTKKNHYKNR